MLQLAWPWLLLSLPLPWLLRVLLPPVASASGGTLYVPFTASLQPHNSVQPGSSSGVRWWYGWAWLCWLLLVLAACRPQWVGPVQDLPATGRNLLLAVDVSGSMEADDLGRPGVSRLDIVKQLAGSFIQRREGDRIGLILFGTRAYRQTPLTFDRVTVRTLLNQAVIGLAGRETAIGDAIGMAIKQQRHSGGETVLVLLTDGSNTAGNVPPRKAAKLAADQKLRIYTIGVGGRPRTVQGLLGPRPIDPSAQLDEATLRDIAEITGGRYFRADDQEQLEQIYLLLDKLEPAGEAVLAVRSIAELYVWPLGLGLLITLLLSFNAVRREVRR